LAFPLRRNAREEVVPPTRSPDPAEQRRIDDDGNGDHNSECTE
jgi:hypothetical protein